MRARALATLFLALVVPVTAQTIEVSDTGWDFGPRVHGDKAEKVITIKNIGGAPLVISKVKGECGCVFTESVGGVKPDYIGRVKNVSVAPGASIKLVLGLDAVRGRGVIDKTLTIDSNDPLNPAVVLTIKGEIEAVWWVEHNNVNVGKLESGIDNVIEFRVHRRKGHDVKITNVTSSSDQVTATYTPIPESEGGEGWDFKVTVAANTEVGSFEQLLLVASDYKPLPQFGMRFFGEIVGTCTVSPQKLAFGVVEKGKSKTLKVKVHKRNGAGAVLAFVECSDDRVSTEIAEKAKGKSWEIEVTFKAGDKEGSFRTKLQITVDEPGQTLFEVQIYGRIR